MGKYSEQLQNISKEYSSKSKYSDILRNISQDNVTKSSNTEDPSIVKAFIKGAIESPAAKAVGTALDVIDMPFEYVGEKAKKHIGEPLEKLAGKTITPYLQSQTNKIYEKRPEEKPGWLRTAEYLPESIVPEVVKQESKLASELLTGKVLSKPLEMLGKGMQSLGSRALEKLTSSTVKERQLGFSTDLIKKHELGWSPDKIVKNTENKLDELMDIKKNKYFNKMPNVEIQQVFKNAEDIINAKGKTEINMAAIPDYKKQASNLLSKLFDNAMGFSNKNGEMTAKKALDFQRSIGRVGNWGKDIDKSVAESVYNTIYTAFKRNFQVKAPTKELKLLNSKIHDLVLVDTNMARRYPQLSRYAPLGLEDTIYFGNAAASQEPAAGIMAGVLNKSIRSPYMYPIGKQVEKEGRAINKTAQAAIVANLYRQNKGE